MCQLPLIGQRVDPVTYQLFPHIFFPLCSTEAKFSVSVTESGCRFRGALSAMCWAGTDNADAICWRVGAVNESLSVSRVLVVNRQFLSWASCCLWDFPHGNPFCARWGSAWIGFAWLGLACFCSCSCWLWVPWSVSCALSTVSHGTEMSILVFCLHSGLQAADSSAIVVQLSMTVLLSSL
jgi:hypothetical protein